MSADRHNGKTSRGGVPAAQTADELLHHDDGTLGALLVGSLCSADVRHSNFAALGRLVRLGVRFDGADVLGEVVRRPGKHRPQPRRAPDGPSDASDAEEQRRCAEWDAVGL
jgi:hypothetical protein